jgi:site-specific recombinase XerD
VNTARTEQDLTALSLADLAASWATALAAERKAEGTIRSYRMAVDRFAAWHQAAAPGLPVVASSLDRKTAAAFLADLLAAGAAPSTARARYDALRQFTKWLAAEGETGADQLLGLRPPRLDKRRVDALTSDQVAALVRACRIPPGADRWGVFERLRDEAVIRLLADTGLRAGEAVALTTADVDLARRAVVVRRAKGGKHRLAAFSADTARALDRYLRRARRGHKLAATPPARVNAARANRPVSTSYRRAASAETSGFAPGRPAARQAQPCG